MLNEINKKKIFRATYDFYDFCVENMENGKFTSLSMDKISAEFTKIMKTYNSGLAVDIMMAILEELSKN